LSFEVTSTFGFFKNGPKKAVQYLICPIEETQILSYVSKIPPFLKEIDLSLCGKANEPWIMTKKITADLTIFGRILQRSIKNGY